MNRKVSALEFWFLSLFLAHRFGPYYTEPVIAGLDPKTFKPFICSLDLIGCPMVTDDFVVSGTCAEQMYGMCESLWEPNMVSWWHGVGMGSEVPSPLLPSGKNMFTWQVVGENGAGRRKGHSC